MSSLIPPLRPAARAAVVAAVCVGGLAAGVGPALAAFPGANGKIAFTRDGAVPGDLDIWTMSPNGRNLVNLTPNSPAQDHAASWSADGRKIAFMSDRVSATNPEADFEIFVMNANGSNQTQITSNALDDEVPAWSPDGRRIVFQRDFDPIRGEANYDIFTMKASGAEQRNITNHPDLNDRDPDWSPDGRRIAFVSERDGNAEIYTMNPDGSRVHRLTFKPKFDVYPNWSPDGQRIAFHSDRDAAEDEPQGEIYTMHATGRDQRRLTFHALYDLMPAWSPDGCKIAFWGFPDATAEDPFANADVFTINIDGSRLENLTNDPGFERVPDWQPLPDHRGHGGRDHADRSSCRR